MPGATQAKVIAREASLLWPGGRSLPLACYSCALLLVQGAVWRQPCRQQIRQMAPLVHPRGCTASRGTAPGATESPLGQCCHRLVRTSWLCRTLAGCDCDPVSTWPCLQAIVPITEIAQGNHDHQWQLTDLHNSDKVVGSVKVTADYKWLRDTKDEGSYEHASQVVINKRRMRQFLVSHGGEASQCNVCAPMSCLTVVQAIS